MKTLIAIFMLLGAAWVHAQTPSEKELAKNLDPVVTRTTSDSVVFQAKMVERLFGVPMELDGAIPKAMRAENVLQLFNPLAPPEYGSGYDNVTTDPDTGKPTGVRVLGIRF